ESPSSGQLHRRASSPSSHGIGDSWGVVNARVDSPSFRQVNTFPRQVQFQASLSAEEQRQPHRESAATADLALQRYLAAQNACQLAGDRQSQPGAAVLARQWVGALAKLLEDQLLFL